MSQSNVGSSGDQLNSKEEESNTAERFNEGKPNSHLKNDSKDERSIANKLAAEEKRDENEFKSEEDRLGKIDATLPARSHGNEPSRGAKIDQELREEEEEYLRKKDAKK